MSDAEKSRGWWQTLPGIITGLTAIVTALAGLVVAIQQTGWFGARTPRDVTRAPVSTPAAPSSAPANELVAAQSAKEGDVLFVIPRGTTGVTLKITYGDESTEVPLDLTSPA
jgi:hypothetical protein